MNPLQPKRRGPLTLLCESRRFRWGFVAVLAVLLATATTIFVRSEFRNLKGRSARVAPGMTRAEVEEILGPPALFLQDGKRKLGGVLVWVDQLWQVDVMLDESGAVSRCGSKYSHSALRRALGQVGPLP